MTYESPQKRTTGPLYSDEYNTTAAKLKRLGVRLTCALGLASPAACATEYMPPTPPSAVAAGGAENNFSHNLQAPEKNVEGQKTLADLLTESQLLNPDGLLTEVNFPPQRIVIDDLQIVSLDHGARLVDAKKELIAEGMAPATVYEALIFATRNPEDQTQRDYLSISDVDSPHRDPLYVDFGMDRELNGLQREVFVREVNPPDPSRATIDFGPETRYLVHVPPTRPTP